MSSKTKPNIILFLCDQLRAFELGCYGHPVIKTPNIDRLADEGAMFRTACSNSPLCVPARSALLSGQHARTCTGTTTNFCGLPPSRERIVCTDPLLPELLREHGYATGLVGKWHLHPAPDIVGFQEGTMPHNHHQHHNQYFYDVATQERTQVPGFSLDYESDHVRRFIRSHRDEPFFLEYSLSPPHSPLADAPEKYLRMYSPQDAVLRDNTMVEGVRAQDHEWFLRYQFDFRASLMRLFEQNDWDMTDDHYVRKTQSAPHATLRLIDDLTRMMREEPFGDVIREKLGYVDDRRLEGFDLRHLTALYCGMVSCVDDYVGRLMQTLREEGIEENTLVVFTSDHGDNLGSHNLWNKGHIFDESIRIPLIFRWPRAIEPKRIDERVASLIDVMPSVLSMAGIPTPASVQGEDLTEDLCGHTRQPTGRSMAFIEGLFPQIGVRTPTHLYGIEMETGTEAEREPLRSVENHYFYDMRTDPYQMRNLAARGGDEGLKAELRNSLLDWHERTPRLTGR